MSISAIIVLLLACCAKSFLTLFVWALLASCSSVIARNDPLVKLMRDFKSPFALQTLRVARLCSTPCYIYDTRPNVITKYWGNCRGNIDAPKLTRSEV